MDVAVWFLYIVGTYVVLRFLLDRRPSRHDRSIYRYRKGRQDW